MCGIAGVIDTKPVERKNLQEMVNTLIHRGPDSEGYFIDKNVGMGIRRLSVIDIETGNQPIYNEDKSIVVVCNGEIYNFRELREKLKKRGHQFYTKGDIEPLVHLYEEKGEEFVKELTGMYALALWDRRKKRLILARDRLGIKPLYYTLCNGVFGFASEIKALFKYPVVSPEVDMHGIYFYFVLRFVPEPFTIYNSIFALPPASILIWENGKIKIKKYWRLNHEEVNIDEKEALEKFDALFEDAVRKRMISDVPLGILLSGGIDSSLVLLYMAKNSKTPVKSFTIGFKEKPWDESKDAERIAGFFNSEHHTLLFEPENLQDLLPYLLKYFDEPFGSSSILVSYYVSKLARDYVTVALAGDGGDELFGGYTIYHGLLFAQKYRNLPGFISARLIPSLLKLLWQISEGEMRYFFERVYRISSDSLFHMPEFYIRKISVYKKDELSLFLKKEILEEIQCNIKEYFLNIIARENIKDEMKALFYLILGFYLHNSMLKRVDRMSMAASLEVRVPFLDHRVVEFAYSLPLNLKIKGFTRKYLLKKILRGKVPSEVIRKKKKGFSLPARVWFRGNLADILEKPIQEYPLSIFNQSYIKELLSLHREGKKDLSEKLWLVLVFYEWAKMNNFVF